MQMKNSEYWQDRMVQLELNALKKGEVYYKNLQEQYDKAIHKINIDITTWYTRLAENNEISLVNAKKKLDNNELKEFKWTLQEYIKFGKQNHIDQMWLKELENASARYHINRLEAIQLQMKQHLEELSNEQNNGMKNSLSDIYSDTYYHTAFEVQKGLNTGWNVEKIDATRIEKVLNTGWADGKNFSDRIWTNKEKLVSSLNTELTQMIIRGESPDRAIRVISARMKVSKRQAGRLIMTESSMIASVSQKDCFNNLDVEEYEIVAALDIDTCEVCGSLDGTHLQLKDYEVGKTAPPFHANCRCCTAPYFSDDNGKRIARDENGKNYYIDSNIKYDDWKQKFVDNSNKKEYNDLDIPKISKDVKSLLKDYKLNSKVEKLFNKYLVDENVVIDNKNSKPMHYSVDKDKIIINPQHKDFKYYNLGESLTHEIIHLIDTRNDILKNNKNMFNDIRRISLQINSDIDMYKKIFKEDEYFYNMLAGDTISLLTGNKVKTCFWHPLGYNNIEEDVVTNIETAYLVNDKIALKVFESSEYFRKFKEKVLKAYDKYTK